MANAHPPRFDYSWENDKTLIMKYKSGRGLIAFAAGLVEGVIPVHFFVELRG